MGKDVGVGVGVCGGGGWGGAWVCGSHACVCVCVGLMHVCVSYPCSIMIVTFNDFTSHSEAVVRDVLRFVGADPDLLPPLPHTAKPAMQVRGMAGGRATQPHTYTRAYTRVCARRTNPVLVLMCASRCLSMCIRECL